MRRFSCECGSHEFKANPSINMIQCWTCGQRYTWEGKWKKFNTTAKDVIRDFCFNPPKEFIENVSKAMKDLWPKVKHPKREKTLMELIPKVKFPRNMEYITAKKESIELRNLRKKWAPELKIMKRHDKVTFDDYAHKGKLRGKHMAKAFHSDVKKLGLKTRLRFVKDKGVVENVL